MLLKCAVFGFSASGQQAIAAAMAPGASPATEARDEGVRPAAATGEAPPPKSALTELLGAADDSTKYGLAPIRWGGTVSDILRWTNYAGSTTFENVVSTNLRAASYIVQPWIAQITGGVGIVTAVPQRSNTGGDSSGSGNTTSMTGNGELVLFPQSRFPFRASVDISDSRTSSLLTTENYVSKRFGLRQDYRPSDSNSSYSVSADRSVLSADSYGDDTVTSLQLSYSISFDTQSIDVNLRHTESTQSQAGQGSTFGSYTAHHTYRPDEFLSLESFASLTDSDLRNQSLIALSDNRSRYLQLNTFANWRPDEEMPLYITGGARFFGAVTDFNGGSAQSRSLSANIGATYNLTRNWTLNGTGTLAHVTAAAASTTITTEGGNISYNSDPLTFENSSYTWNASGSAANQTGGDSGGNHAFSGQIGHNLNYNYPLRSGASLSFNFGQSLFANTNRLAGSSETLTNNGSVSWRVQPSETLTGATTLSLTDTLTRGDQPSHNQFLNLQVNGQDQLSMRSVATANFTLQWSHQGENSNGAAGSSQLNAYGNITYSHSRAFNVRDLRYNATFNVNTLHTDNRLLGDTTAQRVQVGYSLEQWMEYHIGRLNARLTATVGRLDGKENALLFFQVGRDFGDF